MNDPTPHNPHGARGRPAKADKPSFREQLNALRYVPPLLRLVWEVSRRLTASSMVLRLLRGGLPVGLLYVGKLIIDEVVLLSQGTGGDLSHLWVLVGIEMGLAVFSDILGRGIALVDSLLADLFTNETSVRLMRHAEIGRASCRERV